MIEPMKYKNIDPLHLHGYLRSIAWTAEQKLDGVRCLTMIDNDGNVEFSASLYPAFRQNIAAELSKYKGFTFDGELMQDGTYWLFDIIAVAGEDLRAFPFRLRRDFLERFDESVNLPSIRVLPIARTEEQKRDLWQRIQDEHAEGVIFKNLTGTYQPRTRSDMVLKHKITRTADVVVIGPDEHHDAVHLGVYMPNGTLTPVGKASIHMKGPVHTGEVVEVKYLYVLDSESPKMFQPRIVGRRLDRAPESCLIDQFANAETSKEVLA